VHNHMHLKLRRGLKEILQEGEGDIEQA